MKNCLTCNKSLRSHYGWEHCQACRSICGCGRKKDYRSDECRSCMCARTAKIQWQQTRLKMSESLRVAGELRRTRFEDLTWDSFIYNKAENRYQAVYWKEGATKRTKIRRYVWVWLKEVGPIPKGFIVHHKDDNSTHDTVDNLELKTQSQHLRDHNLERAALKNKYAQT